MRVKSLFTNWTTWARADMAKVLKKFRLAGCLTKHPHIKHYYQGLAYFDRYEFDCNP